MRVEARRIRGDDVPLQDLLPTIHYEIELVKQTAGTLDDYRGVAADVLLLYGSNTDSKFKVTAEALQSVLPHSICIELPDLDHRSAQDYGKPERIAPGSAAFLPPSSPAAFQRQCLVRSRFRSIQPTLWAQAGLRRADLRSCLS